MWPAGRVCCCDAPRAFSLDHLLLTLTRAARRVTPQGQPIDRAELEGAAGSRRSAPKFVALGRERKQRPRLWCLLLSDRRTLLQISLASNQWIPSAGGFEGAANSSAGYAAIPQELVK